MTAAGACTTLCTDEFCLGRQQESRQKTDNLTNSWSKKPPATPGHTDRAVYPCTTPPHAGKRFNNISLLKQCRKSTKQVLLSANVAQSSLLPETASEPLASFICPVTHRLSCPVLHHFICPATHPVNATFNIVHLSVRPAACLYVRLSVRPSLCLSV
jgi:hypothetical protein